MLLEKVFISRGLLTKRYLDIFNEVYSTYKNFEHENIVPDGKKIEEMIKRVDMFIEEMQGLASNIMGK